MKEDERRKVLQHIPRLCRGVKSVLDFGCSTCILLDLFPRNINKYGIDIDEEALNVCKEKGYRVFKELDEAPIVECITMVDVLEHLDPGYFVNELLPKLKGKLIRGGRLYIQTYNPCCPLAHIDFYNDYTHKTMWTLESLAAILRMHGFKIASMGYLFPIQSQKRAINYSIRLLQKLLGKNT